MENQQNLQKPFSYIPKMASAIITLFLVLHLSFKPAHPLLVEVRGPADSFVGGGGVMDVEIFTENPSSMTVTIQLRLVNGTKTGLIQTGHHPSIKPIAVNGNLTENANITIYQVHSNCHITQPGNLGRCLIPSIQHWFPDFKRMFGTFTTHESPRFIKVSSRILSRTCQPDYPSSSLCYTIKVDGVEAITRPRDYRRSISSIMYHPSPILSSASLINDTFSNWTHRLFLLFGHGFNMDKPPAWKPNVEYSLLAFGDAENVSFQCYKEIWVKNMFICASDNLSTLSVVNSVTITIGNWSATAAVTMDGIENLTAPVNPRRTDGRPRFLELTNIVSSNMSVFEALQQMFEHRPDRRLDHRPPPPRPPRPPPRPPRRNWRPATTKVNDSQADSITSDNSGNTAGKALKIAVPIGVVALSIIAIVALLFCLRKTPLRKTIFFQKIFPTNNVTKIDEGFTTEMLPVDIQRSLVEHQIDGNRLIISSKQLGEGFFGVVKSAILNPPSKSSKASPKLNQSKLVACKSAQNTRWFDQSYFPQKVAVKTIQKSANFERAIEFFKEAQIMFSLEHPNILNALGYVEDVGGFPAIVLPLMDRGNLHRYVRINSAFDLLRLYDFSLQIANGMAYLSSNHLIHRDLAARNCLLDRDLNVKVSDFGLTRQSDHNVTVYETLYETKCRHRPMPIRWMAPECFEKGIFTEKTDVWAFGVLMWELATRGQQPYGSMESSEVVTFITEHQGRLPMIAMVNAEMYIVMQKCWRSRGQERPTFGDLVAKLRRILENKRSMFDDYSPPDLVKSEHQQWTSLGKTTSLPITSFTEHAPLGKYLSSSNSTCISTVHE